MTHSAETSREMPAAFLELTETLLHESAELRSQVLLWQRWVRYAAATLAAGGAVILALRGAEPAAWLPIAIAASLYLFLVMLVTLFLEHGTAKSMPPSLPAVVMLVDIATLAVIVYTSAPPSQYHRVLLLGFLVLQLTVFYFGQTLGIWAGALTVVAYVAGALFLPAYVPGDRPTPMVVAFNTAVFLFVAVVLIVTFGGFRQRMNRLRQFCKRVEVGDLAVSYDADKDLRPDDLTLLAKSVDEMRQHLIELIGTDALTSCLNRRALETRLRREWRSAKRRGATLAVLAIDIDEFKVVNDTHGHPVGDLVLQDLAEIMRQTARETDAIARLGGDEFVILLPDAGWTGATTFAERLRHTVNDHVFGAADASFQITISIGVALARGSDPDITAESLLEEADRSLYKAKSGGRNRISA